VNAVENQVGVNPRPIYYWRLWLLNAASVSAGALFFLAAQYGTFEFFGVACLMALLPLIPVLVMVGGAGSTIFALTKVQIEKRRIKKSAALALLVGPGLVLTVLLVSLGAAQSPAHRLAYICLGNVPASASHVRVTGYSTFLHKEWLAVFNAGRADFQAMVAKGDFVPVDDFVFKEMLEKSALKKTRLCQSLPPLKGEPCYQRVFKEGEEHKSGSIYAAFDPATSTAIVWRGSKN
jgi:hypothetical protein